MNEQSEQIDLGCLADPVLVFGGPYSNLAATQAMRQCADELGIPPNRVICTGDLIAYCAEPQETLQLIQDWGIAVVQGNCEESLGNSAADCGCGFEEGTACSLLSVEWYQYATQKIAVADKIWMRDLPKSLGFEFAGRSVTIVHGGVKQLNRFIFPSTPKAVKQEELELAGSDILITGHSGIPSVERIDNRVWINAGVIGLPANDGTQDGWFLLLIQEENRIHFSWQRLSYAADLTQRKMLNAGLKSGYAETFLTGLWPSMDVLPDAERARCGEPIEMESLEF